MRYVFALTGEVPLPTIIPSFDSGAMIYAFFNKLESLLVLKAAGLNTLFVFENRLNGDLGYGTSYDFCNLMSLDKIESRLLSSCRD